MFRRTISRSLLTALQDTPVVFLAGARQTGKSTLVQQLTSKEYPARYLTLDETSVLSAARHDPSGFLANLDEPVVLDEVQRAEELFLALKLSVDRNRRPGRFLLTGSADVLLLPRLSQVLAGRMEILTLWPLSQGEIEGIEETFIDDLFGRPALEAPQAKEGRAQIFHRALRGGYPEVLGRATQDRQRAWFESYINMILQRDVQQMSHIEGLIELPRLLSLLGARSGCLLNASELSRSMALPLSTLKRYLALLETLFLLQPLPAWSGNLSKRLVKSRKIFLNDTGLMAYLTGLKEDRLSSDPHLAGPLLENFVVMELRKQISWSRTRPRLFHLRTQTGQEVDVLLEDRAGQLVGIEIKAGSTVTAEDFKNLRVVAETLKKRFLRGIVLYTGSESIPFGSNLTALPIYSLWQ